MPIFGPYQIGQRPSSDLSARIKPPVIELVIIIIIIILIIIVITIIVIIIISPVEGTAKSA